MRKTSHTYGKWVGEILRAEDKKQMWIPAGFAHGFLVLTDTAEFMYKTTDYYAPEHEACLKWNDPLVNIKWPVNCEPVLSEKDQLGKSISEAEKFD